MIAANSMRARLRAATAPAHERMHAHPGFRAAAAGTLSISDYRALLRRLYGFHRPFELAMRLAGRADIERERSHLIEADLRALGLDSGEIARIPFDGGLWAPDSEAEALGSLYVLEGSTLGGVQIARALRAVVGPGERGRRFFLGHGERQGAMWRAFLDALEPLAGRPADAEAALDAAVRTFAQFEYWMRDWREPGSPPAVAAVAPAEAAPRR